MKVAGRKTEGAWFRTNKDIQGLNTTEKANLASLIGASDYIDAAFNALLSLKDECGLDGVSFPATSLNWATLMCTSGIPHQVWFGRLSWTTYTKVGGVYKANYQSQIMEFAKDLRKICKVFFFARRQLLDLGDSTSAHNPGLLPDAHKGS
jgi:hypothetical protein